MSTRKGDREAIGAQRCQPDLWPDVARVEASLAPPPPAGESPALVVVSGVPGSGKSYFCRRLMHRRPLVRLESDALRQLLFPSPTYSAAESHHLFAVIHVVLERLLRRGHSVVLDATNLRETHRRHLYAIAQATEARLVLVRTRAPAALVRQRLLARSLAADPNDHSQADIQVYQRLRRQVQAIHRPHLVVDTAQDVEPFINEVLRRMGEAQGPR
ncbi:MAG: AAA family ATPase [Dehalococcoidia bacterium]